MKPRRALLVAGAVVTLGLLGASCASTTEDTKGRADTRPSALRALKAVTSRFAKVTVPGAVCGDRHPVELHYGEGVAGDPGRGLRFVNVVANVVYGKLGDGTHAAALKLMCSKSYRERRDGDDGQLRFTWVIFTAPGDALKVTGTITSQQPPAPNVHVPLLGPVTIRPGRIIVPEYWYGPRDRNCCPSGRATAVWRYANGVLRLEKTVVTRRPSLKVRRLDLHGVNWLDVALPGSVCGASHPIQLRGGAALVAQTRWGRRWRGRVYWPAWPRVTVYAGWNPVVYGDLDGDGREEAALGVFCSIPRGTASSVLAYAKVIFTAAENAPRAIGEVTPRSAATYGAPSVQVRIRRGKIVAHEFWYGPKDGTCCRSGRSTTVWTYRNRTLSPIRTVIERRPRP